MRARPMSRKAFSTATVVNPTGGAEAVAAAEKLLHGDKTPKNIVLPTRMITKGGDATTAGGR